VLARLLAGQAPGLHQVLHEGVVRGDLGELALAQEVGARVPHVDHDQLVAATHDGYARGAQAGQVRLGGGAGHEVRVGLLDGTAQQAEQLAGLVGIGV